MSNPVASYTLRESCKWCNFTLGRMQTRNGQDCVYCGQCDRFLYNAPKTETGREVRSVTTNRIGIPPSQRSELMERANRRCEVCGKSSDQSVMHVGHVVSLKHADKTNLTPEELNSNENLMILCDECNLGWGENPLPARMLIAVVTARLKRDGVKL